MCSFQMLPDGLVSLELVPLPARRPQLYTHDRLVAGSGTWSPSEPSLVQGGKGADPRVRAGQPDGGPCSVL
jgi:hypothetical protein